jgi:acyl-CoA thioester hydrolase
VRSDFRFFTRVQVRWGDMDAFGHVNNAVFFTYCESARIAFFAAVDIDGLAAAAGPGQRLGPGLVSASLDFRRQVHYPAEVDVGLRVGRIGGKSYPLEYALFVADDVVAEGTSVVVWVDYAARGGAGEALALPDTLRGRLEGFRRGN